LNAVAPSGVSPPDGSNRSGKKTAFPPSFANAGGPCNGRLLPSRGMKPFAQGLYGGGN